MSVKVAAKILLCAVLSASASHGHAEDLQKVHPGPWPISDWHKHQPTQKGFDALREKDFAPGQEREGDRLYMQSEDDKYNIISPERRNR
jgi:hypothetical protein